MLRSLGSYTAYTAITTLTAEAYSARLPESIRLSNQIDAIQLEPPVH